MGATTLWAERMQPYVDTWVTALEHVVTETPPRRCCVGSVHHMVRPEDSDARDVRSHGDPPPIPDVHRTLPAATYPVRRDQNYDHAVSLGSLIVIYDVIPIVYRV